MLRIRDPVRSEPRAIQVLYNNSLWILFCGLKKLY